MICEYRTVDATLPNVPSLACQMEGVIVETVAVRLPSGQPAATYRYWCPGHATMRPGFQQSVEEFREAKDL